MTKQSMMGYVCAGALSLLVAGATLQAQAPAVPSDGIKVHGRWTVTVRNADGSLASQTVVENALVAGAGDASLVNLLARRSALRFWSVHLNGGVCSTLAPGGIPVPTTCDLREAGDPLPPRSTSRFKTLTVGTGTDGPAGRTLVLTGTARADLAGQLTEVSTVLLTSSAMTGLDEERLFSRRVLPSPIPVAAGQSIDVTVVISFS